MSARKAIPRKAMPTLLLMGLAMIAFAGNSLLARAAISPDMSGESAIGPLGFTAIRLVSGALVLCLYVRGKSVWRSFNPKQTAALFVYALFFSIAYVNLPAGVGALILFLSVQMTMLLGGYLSGERLRRVQKIGVGMALLGIVILFGPSVSVPPIIPAFLMVLSGVGWGAYSLLGRKSSNPFTQTASNFFFASIAVLIMLMPLLSVSPEVWPNQKGVAFAIISGALTSGLGYVIWFKVLPSIRSSTAAVSQLTVPIIAAIGGIIWLSEPLTWSFTLASLCIVGGLWLTIARPKKLYAACL